MRGLAERLAAASQARAQTQSYEDEGDYPSRPALRTHRRSQQQPNTFLPPETELETQRKHLMDLAHELDRMSTSAAEAQAEKELLVAERSLVLLNLKAASRVLVEGPSSDWGDADAAEHAQKRIADLRRTLPSHSSAKKLSETSDLLPYLQALRQQLQDLHIIWHEEVGSAERAHLQADAALKAALHGKQAAEEEVQGLSQQVKEMQLLLSKFEEESNSEARCLAKTSEELREQLKASEARFVVLQAEYQNASSYQQELQAQRLQAQHKLQQGQQQHCREQREQKEILQQQHLCEVRLLHTAHLQEKQLLQQRMLAMEEDAQRAAARAEAEAASQRAAETAQLVAKHECEMKAKELKQQKLESSRLQDENIQLQIIVSEAGKQLQAMQQDIQNVKRKQDRQAKSGGGGGCGSGNFGSARRQKKQPWINI